MLMGEAHRDIPRGAAPTARNVARKQIRKKGNGTGTWSVWPRGRPSMRWGQRAAQCRPAAMDKSHSSPSQDTQEQTQHASVGAWQGRFRGAALREFQKQHALFHGIPRMSETVWCDEISSSLAGKKLDADQRW